MRSYEEAPLNTRGHKKGDMRFRHTSFWVLCSASRMNSCKHGVLRHTRVEVRARGGPKTAHDDREGLDKGSDRGGDSLVLLDLLEGE